MPTKVTRRELIGAAASEGRRRRTPLRYVPWTFSQGPIGVQIFDPADREK